MDTFEKLSFPLKYTKKNIKKFTDVLIISEEDIDDSDSIDYLSIFGYVLFFYVMFISYTLNRNEQLRNYLGLEKNSIFQTFFNMFLVSLVTPIFYLFVLITSIMDSFGNLFTSSPISKKTWVEGLSYVGKNSNDNIVKFLLKPFTLL